MGATARIPLLPKKRGRMRRAFNRTGNADRGNGWPIRLPSRQVAGVAECN
jgi:hypothetical protein